MTEIRHLNQVDLSRRLGVSCRTLERWRWVGVGPKFIKVGGRVKYRLRTSSPSNKAASVNRPQIPIT
jgi:predicted site-specific integrase-resolvase